MAAINWKNPVNGDWSIATNWSTDTVPTSGDDVTISAVGPYTVTISSADSANSLTFNASQAALLETAGSLTMGALTVESGFVSLSEAKTIGSVALAGGVLGIGNGAALGTGPLTFGGGELLGTATTTFANAISLFSATTFAAAPGTTLNLTGGVDFAGNNTVDIGAPGQDGEVLWSGAPSGMSTGDRFDVLDGTLTAGSLNLEDTLGAIAGTTVEAGATLDWAGQIADINHLQGAGTVTNSGAAQTMVLDGNFSGTISGALSLTFVGNTGLSGLEDYTGGATIDAPNTVTNNGTYDMVANTYIAGTSAATFVNNALFEKTGGGGVSAVTSNFVNNGTLNVLSGSVQFSDGFTNNGLIHGLVTKSGGVTTISAPVPSDFNGDGLSDILWRNANGDTALWLSNSSGFFTFQDLAVVGGDWQIAGTGGFNGVGEAGILWRNANGDTALWNSNGSGGFAFEDLGDVPTSWQIAGTGDFTGTGKDGILWRNSNGDTALWNPNGSGAFPPFTFQDLGVVPTSWQIAGTGDFTGTGKNSILWRNSNGDTALWNPNGSGAFTFEDLGDIPTSWQIAGTGDFDGSGKDGILWRNSNGDTALWNPNGSGGFTFQDLGVVPTSWQIAGSGDFDGSGKDGILWRNSNGDTALWDPNGSGAFTFKDLGVVSGDWSVHKIFA